jgi:hypothetical protein
MPDNVFDELPHQANKIVPEGFNVPLDVSVEEGARAFQAFYEKAGVEVPDDVARETVQQVLDDRQQ